jgi:hypothetical protein
MRTRRGLPFMTTLYMQLILESILARVQRDSKVIIDHIIWMANHVHIIIQAKDAAACKNFYGEVQKQITEAMKRLLNLEHLNLWGSNTVSVVEIVGLDTFAGASQQMNPLILRNRWRFFSRPSLFTQRLPRSRD